jgi:hypothetical protein
MDAEPPPNPPFFDAQRAVFWGTSEPYSKGRSLPILSFWSLKLLNPKVSDRVRESHCIASISISQSKGAIAPLSTHLGLELGNCQISHIGDRLHRDIPFEALKGDLLCLILLDRPRHISLFAS